MHAGVNVLAKFGAQGTNWGHIRLANKLDHCHGLAVHRLSAAAGTVAKSVRTREWQITGLMRIASVACTWWAEQLLHYALRRNAELETKFRRTRNLGKLRDTLEVYD